MRPPLSIFCSSPGTPFSPHHSQGHQTFSTRSSGSTGICPYPGLLGPTQEPLLCPLCSGSPLGFSVRGAPILQPGQLLFPLVPQVWPCPGHPGSGPALREVQGSTGTTVPMMATAEPGSPTGQQPTQPRLKHYSGAEADSAAGPSTGDVSQPRVFAMGTGGQVVGRPALSQGSAAPDASPAHSLLVLPRSLRISALPMSWLL